MSNKVCGYCGMECVDCIEKGCCLLRAEKVLERIQGVPKREGSAE